MKKKFFMALVAVSMIFASCGKTTSPESKKASETEDETMSPEAMKAWETVKEMAPAVCSVEALGQFDTYEDYNTAVQNFNVAVQEMARYQDQYSKEIADSLTTISTQFAETAETATAMIQEAQAAAQ